MAVSISTLKVSLRFSACFAHIRAVPVTTHHYTKPSSKSPDGIFEVCSISVSFTGIKYCRLFKNKPTLVSFFRVVLHSFFLVPEILSSEFLAIWLRREDNAVPGSGRVRCCLGCSQTRREGVWSLQEWGRWKVLGRRTLTSSQHNSRRNAPKLNRQLLYKNGRPAAHGLCS